jgi:hypothetical protein
MNMVMNLHIISCFSPVLFFLFSIRSFFSMDVVLWLILRLSAFRLYTLNDRMTHQLENGLEGNGHDLIKVLSQNLPRNRKAIKSDCYHYTNLASLEVVQVGQQPPGIKHATIHNFKENWNKYVEVRTGLIAYSIK